MIGDVLRERDPLEHVHELACIIGRRGGQEPRDLLHRRALRSWRRGCPGHRFALAISHKSEDRIIIDAIREARPPLSPDAVVDDFAALLKSYHVSRVTGDRYAGDFRASCSANMASRMTWPSRPRVNCSAIFSRV